MAVFSTGSIPRARAGEGVGDQVQPQQLHRAQGRLGNRQEGGQEDGQNLPDVAGEEVVDGLADVGIDPPALLHRRHHRGEVVVGEDHVRRPLGHVGAGFPHGAADVGGLQGGGRR